MSHPVGDYLASIAPEQARELSRIYAIARELAPDAVEGTSYGMPALKVAGKPLVAVMSTKNHLALYPFSGTVVAQVAPDLAGFSYSSGTIRFQVDQPLPEGLVRRILSLRLAQIEAAGT